MFLVSFTFISLFIIATVESFLNSTIPILSILKLYFVILLSFVILYHPILSKLFYDETFTIVQITSLFNLLFMALFFYFIQEL